MKKVAPYGITPPCRAIPLRTAPIPCSRTPKWRFLPPGAASGRNSPASFMMVSVEGARSADPPASSGSFAAIAFSTLPEALRVAAAPASGANAGVPSSPPPGGAPPPPPPLLPRPLPARQGLAEMGEHVVGHEEGRGGGPSEALLREGDLGLPQRRAVRARGVLLVGAAV